MRLAIVFLMAVVVSARAGASVRHVPTDYANIQSAINASTDGDTVLVHPGQYSGSGNRDLVFNGTSVHLRSSGGPSATMIELHGSITEPHRAFDLSTDWAHGIVVEGFTLKGGWVPDDGGVVVGAGGSITFRNCILRNNSAAEGGVVAYRGSGFTAHFIGCEILSNRADKGAAVYRLGSGSSFTDCRFAGGSAEAGGVAYAVGASFTNCEFYLNSAKAGAVFASLSSTVTGCLFRSNRLDFCIVGSDYATVNHCTFWDNFAIVNLDFFTDVIYFRDCLITETHNTLASGDCIFDHSGLHCATISVSHCNIFDPDNSFGWFSGEMSVPGNISADPLLCDPAHGYFRLAMNSPCIGAASDGGTIGAFGLGCGASSGGGDIPEVPFTYGLVQNYPNPFNPETTIGFSLPVTTHVRLTVFNTLGQRVTVLIDAEVSAGFNSVQWDGTDDDGRQVSSGVYFYRIETDLWGSSRKMLLLR